jgi:hypothetical protein
MTYAKFMHYMAHSCHGMKPEDRLEDIIGSCALLWARTCQDMARDRKDSKEPYRPPMTKAA